MASNNNEELALEEKLKNYTQYLSQDPNNLNLLAEVIDINIYLKRYIPAKEKIIDALAIEKDNPYFLLRLSTILIAEADYPASIEITEKLITQQADEPAIQFNHGYALALSEQYSEAKECLLPLFSSNKEAFQLLPATLVRTLHHLGDYDEAIDIANTHLEAQPNDGQIAGMLSLIYFDNEDFANAEKSALEALELAPDNLDALMTAAGTHIGNQNIDEASHLLDRALAIDPNNGRTLAKVSLIDLLNQDLTAAEANIKKALEDMPEHIGSWHLLGWIQILQQNTSAAEQTFTHALSLDRNFGESHGGMGVIAALKGNWEEADEYCKVAKKLDGAAMSIQFVTILKLASKGQSEKIESLINNVMANNTLPGGGTFQDLFNKVTKNNLN